MKKAFLRNSRMFICDLLVGLTLIASLPYQGCVLAMPQDADQVNTSTLSPRINLMNPDAMAYSYSAVLQDNSFPFALNAAKLSESEEVDGVFAMLKYLNYLFTLSSLREDADDAVIDFVMNNNYASDIVSSIIRAQDRMQETPYGITIDREWAEKFKYHMLAKAISTLDDYHFFFMQMEYEFSIQFLKNFQKHLIQNYLMYDDGKTYEERKQRAERLAVYATGQLAKLQMAGGLGSFKPDMVRGGFYKALKKYWGAEKTRNQLHVMGVFYAKAIKGEGELVFDKQLLPVTNRINEVKGSTTEQKAQKMFAKESELVDVAIETMEKVVTWKDIEINMNGIGKVDVTIYRNPHAELHEYWMYCPVVFHEAYPGDANDEFRPVQTFLYREVSMRYLQYLAKKGKIGKKVVVSNSETSTALANPLVINKDLKRYPLEQRQRYKEMFKKLEELEILYHHYNHTIVPAGMGTFPDWKFNDLKINPEYGFITEDGKLDLRMLVGETHDIITGCSTMHTGIMREDDELYKFFAHKIVEDNLFGNSEGSDVERWQAEVMQDIIKMFMGRLKVETAESLFRELNKNNDIKQEFINSMKVVKKVVKQHLIEELFKGTFGELDVTSEELEKEGVNLIDRPIFTFVRRMVPYKCCNRIIDMIEDKDYRERIIKSGAVLILGGRKFDDFAASQHRRIKELIKQDPRIRSSVLFVSNHNVGTSWLLQQGTDNGGMLSWEGMEAGPTSPGNAGLNWAAAFSTIDGVMAERVIPIERDENGKVIFGTGYVVAYGEERADNRQRSRLPDKQSIMQELEKSCRNYFQGEDHDEVCFNNILLNMTQGDIVTQGSGLLMNIVRAVERKIEKQKQWEDAIEKFVAAQSDNTLHNICYLGDNGASNFYFHQNWPMEKMDGGLEQFVLALKVNTEKGYIYKEAIDIINYLHALLKNKRNNSAVFKIIDNINGTAQHYSPLTYYQKQKELLSFLETFVARLNRKSDSLTDDKATVYQFKNIPAAMHIEISI